MNVITSLYDITINDCPSQAKSAGVKLLDSSTTGQMADTIGLDSPWDTLPIRLGTLIARRLPAALHCKVIANSSGSGLVCTARVDSQESLGQLH